MQNLVVLNRDDLDYLVKKAAENMKAEATAEPARKLKMTLDEALIYLNEQGFTVSKSTIYKNTMSVKIPFKRFGDRKIIFDDDNLNRWVSDRMS